jgi:hypothetical protein
VECVARSSLFLLTTDIRATFRRKNRIFGSTQAHSKAEKPHRNARWGGFEVVN